VQEQKLRSAAMKSRHGGAKCDNTH
jgi:hypothetical protein